MPPISEISSPPKSEGFCAYVLLYNVSEHDKGGRIWA